MELEIVDFLLSSRLYLKGYFRYFSCNLNKRYSVLIILADMWHRE